ncbi:ISL3 family transposase [Brevibacillus centrosporus]|uniref:ISL3 family transposase n=1 Tax=Brevibacillus centrosporus TaxID=54910 RepID=UPI003D2103D5
MMNILNLPTFNVTNQETNENGDYVIWVESVSPPSRCPDCGFDSLYKHGTKKQLFMDLPMHGKRVGIAINRQRYKCRNCPSSFFEKLPDIDDKRMMTRRLVQWIEERSLKLTFTSIADEIGVDEKTVRNIFRDYVNRLEEQFQRETPKWLGMDEVHLLRKYRGVVTNVERRTVIEILKNRNQDTMTKYLFSLPNRERIKYVAMDMWMPYKNAVQTALPHAKIVIDKFHVVKEANDAMEKIRKANRNGVSAKQRKQLMHDRFVLLRRRHDLRPQDIIKFELWTKNFEMIGTGYDLKEEFYEIYDTDNKIEAYNRYVAWKEKIPDTLRPYFEPVISKFDNWTEEILNYFDYRITNAYTESLNRLIKTMHHIGRGYSFEALRAKILFTEGMQKTKVRGSSKRSQMRSGLGHAMTIMERACGPVYYSMWEECYGTDISTLIKALEEGEL